MVFLAIDLMLSVWRFMKTKENNIKDLVLSHIFGIIDVAAFLFIAVQVLVFALRLAVAIIFSLS